MGELLLVEIGQGQGNDRPVRAARHQFAQEDTSLGPQSQGFLGVLATGALGLPDHVTCLAITTQQPLISFDLLDLFDVPVDRLAIRGLKRQIE